MDSIRLKKMWFQAQHGALPHESHVSQAFWVEVDLSVDLTDAQLTDALTDTVNYARVAETVAEVMHGEPKRLLEGLAGAIVRGVRHVDSRIVGVTVRVGKAAPPLDVLSDGVEVEVHG